MKSVTSGRKCYISSGIGTHVLVDLAPVRLGPFAPVLQRLGVKDVVMGKLQRRVAKTVINKIQTLKNVCEQFQKLQARG